MTKRTDMVEIDLEGIEDYREYDFNGRVYTIVRPKKLIFNKGGSTHRVIDADGLVHIVPAPGNGDCVVRFKGKVIA